MFVKLVMFGWCWRVVVMQNAWERGSYYQERSEMRVRYLCTSALHPHQEVHTRAKYTLQSVSVSGYSNTVTDYLLCYRQAPKRNTSQGGHASTCATLPLHVWLACALHVSTLPFLHIPFPAIDILSWATLFPTPDDLVSILHSE